MASADTITLRGLRATGYHGVFAEERREGQVFAVDACLELDLRRAAASDRLRDTVSYAEIAAIIEDHITGEPLDLIEALAQRIALSVLGYDPRVQAATITVHKPSAPMAQDFSDVSIRLRRTRADLDDADGVEAWNALDERNDVDSQSADHAGGADSPVRAVLALGSNLSTSGHSPEQILQAAVEALTAGDGSVTVRDVSPLAKTAPVGGPPGQPDFLNMVVAVDTVLPAEKLLDHAQSIENAYGRQRGERWAARTLDIDIITYGEQAVDTDRLQVPHPRAAERAFVLAPWSWMDPGAVLQGRGVGELAAEAADATGVQPFHGAPQRARATEGARPAEAAQTASVHAEQPDGPQPSADEVRRSV